MSADTGTLVLSMDEVRSVLSVEDSIELQRRAFLALGRGRTVVDLDIDLADGATLAWLYRHGEVVSRRDDEAGVAHLRVGLDPATLARFERRRAAAPAH